MLAAEPSWPPRVSEVSKRGRSGVPIEYVGRTQLCPELSRRGRPALSQVNASDCPSEVESCGSAASFLRRMASLCGTIKASNCSGIPYETTSYFRGSCALVGALADSLSCVGRQQRDGPVTDSGAATAGANDGHAARLRRAYGRYAQSRGAGHGCGQQSGQRSELPSDCLAEAAGGRRIQGRSTLRPDPGLKRYDG